MTAPVSRGTKKYVSSQIMISIHTEHLNYGSKFGLAHSTNGNPNLTRPNTLYCNVIFFDCIKCIVIHNMTQNISAQSGSCDSMSTILQLLMILESLETSSVQLGFMTLKYDFKFQPYYHAPNTNV